MTDRHLSTDDLASQLRTIADTLDGPSGWGIAAIKVRDAADRIEMMRAALLAITEGRGAFSQDHHQFACNVIESAKQTATEALEGRYEYKD